LIPIAAGVSRATIGLVVGIAWAPIGLAAAVGLILYFFGAIAHLGMGDVKGIGTPRIRLG
jgi:hypothetical protein